MLPVENVLFDLDETLFDHEGASEEAVRLWLEDRDIPVTADVLDVWFQSERARFDEYIDGLVSFEQQRRNRIVDLSNTVGLALPRDLDSLDALFHEYIRLYERSWRTFADARPAALAAREAGFGIGILTNGLQSQQWKKVVHTGLADLFPVIAASEALGVAKPNREAFAQACALYGFDPATTCMIGDNHRADVVGARGAGLRAIYVDRRGHGIDDPHRVTGLKDIVDTIRALP